MNAVAVVAGVVGGLALVWLVKTIFTAAAAIVIFVETLLTFPSAPVGDRCGRTSCRSRVLVTSTQ